MWRATAVVGAVLAAAAGVALYVAAPRVGSYQVSGWLTLPALLLALVWLHRRLPLRVQWALAAAIAPVGPVAYLVWGGSQWWNWGQLTPGPLLLLLALRQWFTGEDGDREPWYGGMRDGPWGPPPT